MHRRRGPIALAALAFAASGLAVAAPVAASPGDAAAVTTGFTDQAVADIPFPTAVVGLPDGRVVVLSQTGQVRIIADGVTIPAPALDLHLGACSNGERGLLGFVADPGFNLNGLVYIFSTRPAPGSPGGCVNRVSRFTMVGNTIDQNSETVLIDGISAVGGNHNAGDLDIGADGFLYITAGDAGRSPRGLGSPNPAGQDPSLLNGKILRIDRFSGLPAPGNPFSGPGTDRCAFRGNTAATPHTACQEIFALGLRNPYRFAFDPNASATRFFINDVGQSTREEIDLGALGANYGWPAREGTCPIGENPPCAAAPPGFTDPLFDYPRSVGQYITGAAFVPDGVWPAAYDGGYLFADGGAGNIYFRAADGSVDTANPFASGLGLLADLAFVTQPGSGTSLYYTLAGETHASVHRVSFGLPQQAASGSTTYVPNAVADRVLDTRDPAAGGPAALRGGTTRRIGLARAGAVPPGAVAALVNVTMVQPAGDGYVTAWASRTAMPPTSNVNALAGEVVANASVVPVADGLMLFALSTTDVVVDVLGFFVASSGPSSAGRFQPLGPVRLADTRLPPDAGNRFTERPSDGGTTATVPVLGRDLPIPDGAISAAVLSVAGITSTAGFVTAYPTGGAYPPVSNLNLSAPGDVRANLVIVPLGADGSVDLRMFAVDDVVVDLVGYITSGAAAGSTSGRFVLSAPTRAVDTRLNLGFGRLGEQQTATLNPPGVPDDALGVLQDLVVTDTSGPTFVASFPAGVALPSTSSINATGAGQSRAALAVTPLGTGGLSYYALHPTDVVVDITGYFEA